MFIYRSTVLLKVFSTSIFFNIPNCKKKKTVFRAFCWDTASVVVLHRCSCPLFHHKGCAMSFLLRFGQWCHSWEYSGKTQTKTELILWCFLLWALTLSSHGLILHLKSDPPARCDVPVHHQLVPSLPLEEEPLGGSIWQAGLVVPHQVPAYKPTVVPRVQSSVQQEGVILWTEKHKMQKISRALHLNS